MQTSSTQQNAIDHMFGWWYAIAAPSAEPENTSRHKGNFVRKGRYTSLILLIEIIDTFFTYFVHTSPQLIISLTISILMLFIGVYLNHIGRTMAAGLLVIITIEVSMIAYMLSLGFTQPGLSLAALPTLIVLVQPQLIAISLFPPKVSLPIGAFNCIVVAIAITFLPKTPEMIAYLSINAFDAYFTPIGTLILVSLISLLWANSALREMKRADQSEEVNKIARDIMSNPMLLEELLARLGNKRGPFQNITEENASYKNANDDGGWW